MTRMTLFLISTHPTNPQRSLWSPVGAAYATKNGGFNLKAHGFDELGDLDLALRPAKSGKPRMNLFVVREAASDGTPNWQKIGVAFHNRDGSKNLVIDSEDFATLRGLKLQLRPSQGRRGGRGGSRRSAGEAEAASPARAPSQEAAADEAMPALPDGVDAAELAAASVSEATATYSGVHVF